jgi:hypothetical protein
MFTPCINSIYALFIYQQWRTQLKSHNIKTVKNLSSAPTCFGSYQNHPQGANLCLAKTMAVVTYSRLIIQSMCWQYISLLCGCMVRCGEGKFPSPQRTIQPHNRLKYCQHIDWTIWREYVTTDVVLAKHRLAPWRWFWYEPKHVGADDRFLTVLILCDFNCVRHCW